MLGDLCIHLCHVAAALRPHVLLCRLGVLLHAAPHEWIKRNRQQASRMAPVFEKLALAVRERIEPLHAVRTETRECQNVMRTHDYVHRVDLERMRLRGKLPEMGNRRCRRFCRESLGGDREPARLR